MYVMNGNRPRWQLCSGNDGSLAVALAAWRHWRQRGGSGGSLAVAATAVEALWQWLGAVVVVVTVAWQQWQHGGGSSGGSTSAVAGAAVVAAWQQSGGRGNLVAVAGAVAAWRHWQCGNVEARWQWQGSKAAVAAQQFSSGGGSVTAAEALRQASHGGDGKGSRLAAAR
jgi:hypothetical protein